MKARIGLLSGAVGVTALAGPFLAVQPQALAAAETPPCAPSHAITAPNNQITNMTFRLMRCNNASAVFVEVFNLWPAPKSGERQQHHCSFRVEKSPTGSTPTDTCLHSAGSPRYSDLFTIAPGDFVRAAMAQVILVPNLPEQDWPSAYRFTGWVRV